MAKMFYSLEEAAAKLGKSVAEVKEMASSGRLQEFRDRDNLVFKVEQVDLLATDDAVGDDLDDVIGLADSVGGSAVGLTDPGDDSGIDLASVLEDDGPGVADFSADDAAGGAVEGATPSGSGAEISLEGSGLMGSGLGLEGSGLGLEGSGLGMGPEPTPADSSSGSAAGSGGRSGVSIFDADELEEADPSAVTQMTDGGFGDLSLENVGSGSGLMDLTRESDDTSLGMEDFLEDMPSEDDSPVETVADDDGGLFEAADDELVTSAQPVGAAMMVAAEPMSLRFSAFAGGLALGTVALLAAATALMIMAIVGAPVDTFVDPIADSSFAKYLAPAGVGLVLLLGGVSMALFGRKS